MATLILTPDEVNASLTQVESGKKVHAITLARKANVNLLLADDVKIGSAFVLTEGDETHEKDGATVNYPLSSILSAYKAIVKAEKLSEKIAVTYAANKADGSKVVKVSRVK